MARKAEDKSQKWWLALLVAMIPSLIAGWFSLQAIDKANQSAAQADKTSGELTVAYDLMKQALEMVQHEADADRDALQKTNELLVKLLEQKSSRNAEEAAMLASAKELEVKLRQPPPNVAQVHFPPNLRDLVLQKAEPPVQP